MKVKTITIDFGLYTEELENQRMFGRQEAMRLAEKLVADFKAGQPKDVLLSGEHHTHTVSLINKLFE